MRLDRSLSESRQSSCSIGIIGEASGSGRYKLGRTVATSVIYGPSTPKYGRHEDYRSMNVEVVYSTSLGGGSGAGDAAVGAGNDLKRAEREGSRFIRAGLLGAIDITRCPRSLLLVKVAVDFDDGNSLCAAFNASVIALMNAGIRMNYVPVAVGVAHLLVESTNMAATVFTAASKSNQDNVVEETQSASQGEVQGKMRMLCVDPEKEEEDSNTNILKWGHVQARSVVPRQGSVLVFPHGSSDSPVHEGSPVTQGIKYVIRTDVLYSL